MPCSVNSYGKNLALFNDLENVWFQLDDATAQTASQSLSFLRTIKKKNFRHKLKNYYLHTCSIMFTVFVVMYCIVVIEQNKTFYTQIHMLFNDFFFLSRELISQSPYL